MSLPVGLHKPADRHTRPWYPPPAPAPPAPPPPTPPVRVVRVSFCLDGLIKSNCNFSFLLRLFVGLQEGLSPWKHNQLTPAPPPPTPKIATTTASHNPPPPKQQHHHHQQQQQCNKSTHTNKNHIKEANNNKQQ